MTLPTPTRGWASVRNEELIGSFALESGETISAGSDALGEDLDGNLTTERSVRGSIGFAHSSGADRTHDFE
jgi:hypothetical protein